MNVPVGPGGTPRRRRSDPSCGRIAVDMLAVYALILIIVILDITH